MFAYEQFRFNQMDESFVANDQTPTMLQCQLTNPLKYNMTYTVVIPKGIQLASGIATTETIAHSFSTVYKPLYASPLMIQQELGELFTYIQESSIYPEIRNASKKAHIWLGTISDPNATGFEEMTEDSTNYYAVTQYVTYESSLRLCQQLLGVLMRNEGALPGYLLSQGFTLGDLTVNGSGNSNKQMIVDLFHDRLKLLQPDVQYWKDQLLNRTKRGYASPATGSTRKNTAGPIDRGLS